MSSDESSLYGNVPDKSSVVLLLIDVINDLDFSHGDKLLRQAMPMARNLAKLKTRMKNNGFAVIYANDNFGRWRSDFNSQVNHCLQGNARGRQVVELLRPDNDDYFVLKPAHSGFYSTTLEVLLRHLEAQSLVVTGMATNICVLFTVNDAFLRGYEVWVPNDCVAANTRKLSVDALSQMKNAAKAYTTKWESLPWTKWIKSNTKKDGSPRKSAHRG